MKTAVSVVPHYVNHIALTIDESGSMCNRPVVAVVDKELEYLKRRSVELDQETRISIYTFASTPKCIVFDMDVMRFKTLQGHYQPHGNTALIDAVIQSIKDMVQLPQLYGDHAFLQYVITDGEENSSRNSYSHMADSLRGLQDNWTTACLVPDARGKHEAKKFGFLDDSVAIWDTSSRTGFEGVGKQFSSAMDSYMQMRATGVRSTKGLFTLDTSGLTKAALKPLIPASYDVFTVRKDAPIKEFVEMWTGGYVIGSAYYQPTKKVVIQDYKQVLVQDVRTGKVYEGAHLRQLLGLPQNTTTVDPGNHTDWRVFVQSTSVNRKVFSNTFVIVRK